MCRNISDFAEQIAGISDFLSRKNPSFISDLLLCRRIVSTSLSKSSMFVYQKFGSAFLKNFSLKFQRVPKIQLFCPFCQNLNFWHLFVARFFLYRVTQKCFEKKNSGTCSKSGQNFWALSQTCQMDLRYSCYQKFNICFIAFIKQSYSKLKGQRKRIQHPTLMLDV